jgi:hypothetical protein
LQTGAIGIMSLADELLIFTLQRFNEFKAKIYSK